MADHRRNADVIRASEEKGRRISAKKDVRCPETRKRDGEEEQVERLVN